MISVISMISITGMQGWGVRAQVVLVIHAAEETERKDVQ